MTRIRMDKVYYMAVHRWNKIISVIDEYIRTKPNVDLREFLDWDRDSCIYCVLFGACENCPIKKYTQNSQCDETPWYDVNQFIIEDSPIKARIHAIQLRDLILRAKPKNMMEIVSYS